MELYDIPEENELDTYISREVLVPEGDEPKSLTQALHKDHGIHSFEECVPKGSDYFQ